MHANEFVVGPDIDQKALETYVELLNTAYANGEASGGSMEWNDVQAALDKAVIALGGEAERYTAAAQDGFPGAPEGEEIRIIFAENTDVTDEVVSAAKLLLAYQTPDEVAWEDVDTAWEVLQRSSAPKP